MQENGINEILNRMEASMSPVLTCYCLSQIF